MKNLKYLQKENVLKSKSYGLGKEMLWSLKSHPVLQDLEVKPPSSEIHTFKYEHEKDCAEIFVALMLDDCVSNWIPHKKLRTGLIPDRTLIVDNLTLHIENERGTQGSAKILKKIERYKNYWRETGDSFQVLFLVKDSTDSFTDHFKALNVPYFVTRFDHFLTPLNCIIYSQYGSKEFQTLFQTPI